MNKIILASGSPRRKELLDQVGIQYEVCVSTKEEVTTQSEPEKIVKELSLQKAEDVLQSQKDEQNVVIIAADTMVSYQNKMLGKPGNYDDAVKMLSFLQGNVHQVFTGVTIIMRKDRVDNTVTFSEKTDVEMWNLSDEQIKEYLDKGESMDKAGAYAIQGKGAILVKEIRGDYNNVVGLPVSHVYRELQRLGVELK